MMKKGQVSIGKEKAIALSKSQWWVGKPARELAEFQLFTVELSMPFGVFHKALEESLERPVFTHELALDWDGLAAEFLGEKPTPSMDDIINLIPADKRLLVVH